MANFVLQTPRGKFPGILAAHPVGVKVLAEQQILRAQQAFPQPLDHARGRTALILGSTSFGYGSAVALTLRAAGFDKIIGVGVEKAPTFDTDKATGELSLSRASAGWYLTHALHEKGIIQTTYLANAFADATRERVVQDLLVSHQKIDLLLYSLAAGQRSYNGQEYKSALKVVGEPLSLFAIDLSLGKLYEKKVEVATEAEIESTRQVMGGEDLRLWVGTLLANNLLNEGATVAALSYVGPQENEEIRRLYWDGTIGAAKKDIDEKTEQLNRELEEKIKGKALSVVAPAVVTQASALIPAISKYLSAYLGVVAGGIGIYNDPLQVAIKLIESLYGRGNLWLGLLDDKERLRIDGDEFAELLQKAIAQVNQTNHHKGEPTEELKRGIEIYKEQFYRLFGFGVSGVDYSQPYEFDVKLTSDLGVHDLISNPPAEAPQLTVIAPPPPAPLTVDRQSFRTTAKISRIDQFFVTLLSRNNEEGVSQIVEDGKTVFVSERTLDPERVRKYAELTNQPQDGTVPSAYTFVLAFPNIIDATKDILAKAAKKSIVHAADEPQIYKPISTTGKVKVRAWIETKKERDGVALTFIQRQIFDSQGDLVASGKTTLTIGADLSKLPVVLAKPEDIEGELLGKFTMTQELMNQYHEIAEEINPLHIDKEAARDLGLTSTIAHGIFVLGLVNRDNPPSYKVNWKTPVYPGDEVEIRRSGKKIVGIKTGPNGEKYLTIEIIPKESKKS